MNSFNINRKKKEEARISRISRVSGFSKTQQSLASGDHQLKNSNTPIGSVFGVPIGGDSLTAYHLELQARPSANDQHILAKNLSSFTNTKAPMSPTQLEIQSRAELLKVAERAERGESADRYNQKMTIKSLSPNITGNSSRRRNSQAMNNDHGATSIGDKNGYNQLLLRGKKKTPVINNQYYQGAKDLLGGERGPFKIKPNIRECRSSAAPRPQSHIRPSNQPKSSKKVLKYIDKRHSLKTVPQEGHEEQPQNTLFTDYGISKYYEPFQFKQVTIQFENHNKQVEQESDFESFLLQEIQKQKSQLPLNPQYMTSHKSKQHFNQTMFDQSGSRLPLHQQRRPQTGNLKSNVQMTRDRQARNNTALVSFNQESMNQEYQPFGLGNTAASTGQNVGHSSATCTTKPIHKPKVKISNLVKSRDPLILNHNSQVHFSQPQSPKYIDQTADLLINTYDDSYAQYMNVNNYDLHSLIDKKRGAMPQPRYQLKSNQNIHTVMQDERNKRRKNNEGVSDAFLIAKQHPQANRVNGGSYQIYSSQRNVVGYGDGATLDFEQTQKMQNQIGEYQEKQLSSDSGRVASEDVDDAPQMEGVQGLNEGVLSEELGQSSLIRSSQHERSVQISQIQRSQNRPQLLYKSIESENKQQNLKSFIQFHLDNQTDGQNGQSPIKLEQPRPSAIEHAINNTDRLARAIEDQVRARTIDASRQQTLNEDINHMHLDERHQEKDAHMVEYVQPPPMNTDYQTIPYPQQLHPSLQSDVPLQSLALVSDASALNGKLYFEAYGPDNNRNNALKKNRTLTAKDIVNMAINLRGEIRSHGKKHGTARPMDLSIPQWSKMQPKSNTRTSLAKRQGTTKIKRECNKEAEAGQPKRNIPAAANLHQHKACKLKSQIDVTELFEKIEGQDNITNLRQSKKVNDEGGEAARGGTRQGLALHSQSKSMNISPSRGKAGVFQLTNAQAGAQKITDKLGTFFKIKTMQQKQNQRTLAAAQDPNNESKQVEEPHRQIPKKKSANEKALERIGKEVRALTQFAGRLVAAGEQFPVLRVDGVVQDIEVVPNEPMQFVCRIRDMPTPLRMIIRRKQSGISSKEQADLQVVTSFAAEDIESFIGVGGLKDGGQGKDGRKKYVNPKQVMIESKGIVQGKSDKRGPSQQNQGQRRAGHDHGGNLNLAMDQKARYNEILRSLNTTGGHAGGSVGCSSSNQKQTFTESLLYVTFFSYGECNIQISTEIPESYNEQNKRRLKRKKEQQQKEQAKMQNIFSITDPNNIDPYYEEMLKMNEERKVANKEWRRKQKEKALEKALMQKELEKDYGFDKEQDDYSSEGLDLEELKEEIAAIVQD